jgi:hypothetical protein
MHILMKVIYCHFEASTAMVALFSFGLKRYWQKITIKRLMFLSIGERPLSGNL